MDFENISRRNRASFKKEFVGRAIIEVQKYPARAILENESEMFHRQKKIQNPLDILR